MRFSILVLIAAIGGCTCGTENRSRSPLHRGELDEPTASEPVRAPHDEHAAGGLTWRIEEPLFSRPPSSSMRAAEYGVRDVPDAELTVFFFGQGQGGGVDENIDRWVGQFEQDDGRPSREVAQIERIEVQGMPVTTVEVSGSFAGMNPMGASTARRSGFALRGAIVEGPQGMVFFKLTGPQAGIDASEDAFRALLQSVEPS